MKKISLSICFCLLLSTVYAQLADTSRNSFNADTIAKAPDSVFVPQKYRNIHKRSPVLACLLSVYIPGLGQVYNKQGLKAGILFGTFALSFGAAEVYVNSHRVYYNSGPLYSSSYGRHPNDAVTVALLLPMFGSYLYSIIDAPVTANWLNRTYHLGKAKRSLTSLHIEPALMNFSTDHYIGGFRLVLW